MVLALFDEGGGSVWALENDGGYGFEEMEGGA